MRHAMQFICRKGYSHSKNPLSSLFVITNFTQSFRRSETTIVQISYKLQRSLKQMCSQTMLFIFCVQLCLTLSFTQVKSSNEAQIGPNVRLPSNYDVQVLPSIPVHVNVSVVLFEIISVDEPKQVKNENKSLYSAV